MSDVILHAEAKQAQETIEELSLSAHGATSGTTSATPAYPTWLAKGRSVQNLTRFIKYSKSGAIDMGAVAEAEALGTSKDGAVRRASSVTSKDGAAFVVTN